MEKKDVHLQEYVAVIILKPKTEAHSTEVA
jgi:hypothetical protein